MQLILDASDIDIERNMSNIEESLNEKYLANKIIEPLTDDISNGNKENIQKQDNIIVQQGDDGVTDTDKEITVTKEEILVDNLNEKNTGENRDDVENVEDTDGKLVDINNSAIDTELILAKTVNENLNTNESQTEENEVKLEENDTAATAETKKEQKTDISIVDSSIVSDGSLIVKEVDDMEAITETKKQITEIKKETEIEVAKSVNGKDSEIEIELEEKKKDKNAPSKMEVEVIKGDVECFEIESTGKDNVNEKNATIEIDDEDEKSAEKNNESNQDFQKVEVAIEDTKDLIKPIEAPKIPQVDVKTTKTPEKTTETKHNRKLSNNLDIFSDEEEEDASVMSKTEDSQESIPLSTEKKCISIDDDDDIMVIDEDSSAKDSKSIDEDSKTSSDDIQSTVENTAATTVSTESTRIDKVVQECLPNETDTPETTDCAKETISTLNVEANKSFEHKFEETELTKEPIVPMNFIKSYKKNLADMTRNELEEFCILKIVESIVDRTNLGEIKTQLKILTATMDDCKKKCLMLTKQNKDLQIVFTSFKEDQKYAPDVHITPLKITRSVGMQVVMVDKNNTRKLTINEVTSSNSSNTTNKPVVPTPNQVTRSQKEKNLPNQQIPVPRLVPAITAVKTNQMPSNNNPVKQVGNTLPNGVRTTPPVQKSAEKRSRSQAVTVDLTDDEPPAKLQTVQRNPILNHALRVGGTAPTSIITAQRFGQNVNSARKVYIPISGPQAQNVRPGQTIMLKTLSGSPLRATHVSKVHQNINPVRLGGRMQFNRHPAPLPEATKQYQPPNWKSLPPAPDLKLSKVDNGIVISWRIDNYQEDNHEEIASYQLYAYQETANCPVTSGLWKKIGDVKALPLPMACTLTQFMAGYKYYFAVRAVDVRSRLGPFSLPGSILLLNKI